MNKTPLPHSFCPAFPSREHQLTLNAYCCRHSESTWNMEDKMSDSDYYEFEDSPTFVSKKESMDIKDVIKRNVLPWLPAKALTKFSSASKEWNQWMKSPFLAYQQSCCFKQLSGFFCQNEFQNPMFVSLNASSYGVPNPSLDFLPEHVDILSSCNGLLVCHGRGANEPYYICNPANKQWTPLPRPQLYHGFEADVVLAFEPSPRNIEVNYHLICAVPMFDLVYFELYTSSTNSWKILNATLLEMEGLKLNIKHSGFYMKGVAYWLTNRRSVIAFHVEEDVYEVIPIPDECSSDGVLTQIRGELCYITISINLDHICSIKIHAGLDLSLIHTLTVSFGEVEDGFPRCRALPCLDGEKVMILYGARIYSFSINDQILEEVTRGVELQSGNARKYLPYVNSMVQLH